jgi:hypothetical protein
MDHEQRHERREVEEVIAATPVLQHQRAGAEREGAIGWER